MLYARVVLGIPVEGPFDYIVPKSLSKKIKAGMRVWVSFGTQKKIGYVVGLSAKTKIKNLKAISDIIDVSPVLDKNALSFTRSLSEYYCCSWGETIEAALPQPIRKGRRIPGMTGIHTSRKKNGQDIVLVHDLDGQERWAIYLKQIKEALDNNMSAIILLPDMNSVIRAKEIISSGLGVTPELLYRKQSGELDVWRKVREGKVNIVAGTRSAIFAPFNNLGLIIIDEEQNDAYKQDQVPHYHAREAAFMRSKIEKAKLVLGDSAPSLEILRMARSGKIKYTLLPAKKPLPEVKIIDTGYRDYLPRARSIISKYLEDSILASIGSGDKVLLFLNRKGFATYALCSHCGLVLKCQRCNINLVYHFKDNVLSCHYCNFKMQPPKICPDCNSGYIRYLGAGTEKIESELSRLFPQARIKRIDAKEGSDSGDADIFISTSSIFKSTGYGFGLIGVLSIDNSLSRIDFRSGERTFNLLAGLLGLAEKLLVIQTGFPRHHCLRALANKDTNIFYEEELKERMQLNFPPFSHIGLVKLRGKTEGRVKEISHALFGRLVKCSKNNNVEVVSVNPSQPEKLRDKFCWQILVKGSSALNMSKFLKMHLKDFPRSGIILTVDMDPL